MSRRILSCAACLLLAAVSFPSQACENAAFALLQNLAGRWEVYRNERVIGKLHVQREAGDCVLLEKWQATDGTEAVAMHWTEPAENADDEDDAPDRVLKQIYADSSGWLMKADGTMENGALVYEGSTTLQDQDVVLRATLHGLGGDEIVHIGDVSKDDGATWQRMSTMKYRRIE